MDSLQVSVFTSSEGLEIVSAMLYDLGLIQQEIVEDIADIKQYLDKCAQFWDFIDEKELEKKLGASCVKVYLSHDEIGEGQLEEIRAGVKNLSDMELGLSLGSLDIAVNIIKESDWANNWKKYFKPTPIGNKLIIKPEWENLEDNMGRIVLNIEPGMVFGTGSHQTTQLCMEKLENAVNGGESVLDLGCGSGILAICSLLLGAKNAVGIDIDPNAIKVSYENAKRNGIFKDRLEILSGNIIDDVAAQEKIGFYKYQIVVANIVADVIIALLPVISKQIIKGGTFIASGIIDDRLDDVLNDMRTLGFEVLEVAEKDDWRVVVSIYKGK